MNWDSPFPSEIFICQSKRHWSFKTTEACIQTLPWNITSGNPEACTPNFVILGAFIYEIPSFLSFLVSFLRSLLLPPLMFHFSFLFIWIIYQKTNWFGLINKSVSSSDWRRVTADTERISKEAVVAKSDSVFDWKCWSKKPRNLN
jgi:hypothetical protein